MTDPVSAFGIAIGIVGLIPLCSQGLELIGRAIKAREDLKAVILDFDLQESRFNSWTEVVELKEANKALQYPERAVSKNIPYVCWPVVLRALARIYNTLSNAKTLKDIYGFEIESRHHVSRFNVFVRFILMK